MRAPSSPQPARPLVHELLDAALRLQHGGFRSRKIGRGHTSATRLVGIHPRREVGGREFRKGQQQVAEVALGVNGNDRHAVDRRFFDQPNTQAGFPAARHAGDDPVGHEVGRVIQQRF